MMAPLYMLTTAFTFLAFVTVGYGCTSQPPPGHKPPGSQLIYSSNDDNDPVDQHEPTIHVKSRSRRLAGGVEKRPVFPSSDLISAENFFRDIDANDDGIIDACDWLNSPFATKIKDYVNMLETLDLNGDDALSMDEFKPIKIVADMM